MLCVRAAARGRLYCAAIVSLPLVMAATSQASATPYYYWNDTQPTLYPSKRPIAPRRPRVRQAHRAATVDKVAAKPQGPLLVAVSINKQQLKIYDASGVFAEAPVSTGMKGHSTPMGVFSVIQKQKYHRSNIYSGAPMPFMQRITWSGVALHAGVLPGYPASHGCIRMPASFATRMYGWTRMGSRVVVTPGEVVPTSFSHPLLAALTPPQPSAVVQPDTKDPAATKSDKGAAASTTITVATTDLRSSIGHADDDRSGSEGLLTLSRSRTADASVRNGTSATASDAPPSAGPETAEKGAAADLKPSVADTARQVEDATADAGAKPTKPVAGNAGEQDGTKSAGDSAPSESRIGDSTHASEKPAEPTISTDGQSPGPAITDHPAASATSTDGPAKPAEAKDQSRLTTADKPVAPKPELKRNSQIAIFISRKDSKLYVRQNFAPVFNTAVTIAPSDRPLGTHVFTATTDKADPSVVHWSVVSLPASARGVSGNDAADKAAARHGKKSAQAQTEPSKVAPQVSSAAEALDRITIPADVMAWLAEAVSNGSSLIVSDQGINQGETGEGTDFIVSLR